MSFDKIVRDEEFSLKSEIVKIKGSDKAEYKFTVTELSPSEMALCRDEFGSVDINAIVYRSVRDQDGVRMSVDQAMRLPPEVTGKFIETYNSFFEGKKKPAKKKKKN